MMQIETPRDAGETSPAGSSGDDPGPREISGIIVPAAEVGQASELATGTIARGFDGDRGRLRTFVSELSGVLPPGTVLALRGSAVAGRSFRTGAPFDALGPGTSDLDLVLVGDDARDLFTDDALLLGGINSLPLSDEMPWVAPRLESARRRAQAVARRPVSIQAMAGWFLELRTLMQGQPYVILATDA